MNYSKYFSEIANRRTPNLIRQMALEYIKNPTAIYFASGMPNTRTFPFKEIDISFRDGTVYKLKDSSLDAALQYGPCKGHLPLVSKWKEYQNRWHAPKFENWDIHFTSGSQEGCSKVFELFLNEGDSVMVQIPAYTATLGALMPLRPDFIGIKQDSDGIIPEEIERNCGERLESRKPMPKLLIVNPVGANPTGTVLPDERKEEIYAMAKKYGFLILEDDPYFWINFLEKRPVSFLSIDTDGRVIRFDSFSKIMSGGLRLGVVTGHKDVLDKMSLHVACTSLQASSLSQILIDKLLESWSPEKLEEHFKEIQKFYRERRDMMMSCLEKYLTGLAEWSVPKAGMFVWLKILALEDVYDIVMKECISRNIFIIPGHVFNPDAKKRCQNMRICYSHVTLEETEKGLKILSDILKEAIVRKKYDSE